MAERWHLHPWHMPRLTGREWELIEAEFDVPETDDVEIPEGAERMLEPPVPSVVKGM